MRKQQSLFLLFLLVSLTLSGSDVVGGRLPTRVAPEVVIAMEVTYQNQGRTLHRHYEDPEKIRPFLTMLRLFSYEGRAEGDPERVQGSSCVFVLRFNTGKHRIYRLRAERYLSRNGERWERIDPALPGYLHMLLRAIPGDREGLP